MRNVEAVARAYDIVCPYKNCGYAICVETAGKGDVVECPNCRKKLKIKKVR